MNCCLTLLIIFLTLSHAFDSLSTWTQLLKSLESSSSPRQQPEIRSSENSSSSSCPEGWVEMYYGCYFIPPGKMNYDVSSANCRIMGAKLAEPVDAQVDLSIANLVKFQLGNENYWLGINDRDDPVGRTWVYDSSDEPVQFFNWSPGEPTSLAVNNSGHDCVEVNGNPKFPKKWGDAPCRLKKRSVCELNGIIETFSHYMARHMHSGHWYDLVISCKKLIRFVQKHNKKWQDLPTFNIECLIRTREYGDLYEGLINHPSDHRKAFSEYMNKEMTDDHWRLFLYWILEWEMSLIYLNPPPPEPWPQPFFEKPLFPLYPGDKFSIDDMVLHLLKNRENPNPPTPIYPPCD